MNWPTRPRHSAARWTACSARARQTTVVWARARGETRGPLLHPDGVASRRDGPAAGLARSSSCPNCLSGLPGPASRTRDSDANWSAGAPQSHACGGPSPARMRQRYQDGSRSGPAAQWLAVRLHSVRPTQAPMKEARGVPHGPSIRLTDDHHPGRRFPIRPSGDPGHPDLRPAIEAAHPGDRFNRLTETHHRFGAAQKQ